MRTASPVKEMMPRGLAFANTTYAIREFFTLVGEDRANMKWGGLNPTRQEALARWFALIRQDLQIHPRGGPIDRDKAVRPIRLIGPLRKIFDIDVDKTGIVIFKPLHCLLARFFWNPVEETGNAIASQTAGAPGARDVWIDQRTGHSEQIVERQEQGLSPFDPDLFFLWRESRWQAMRGV